MTPPSKDHRRRVRRARAGHRAADPGSRPAIHAGQARQSGEERTVVSMSPSSSRNSVLQPPDVGHHAPLERRLLDQAPAVLFGDQHVHERAGGAEPPTPPRAAPARRPLAGPPAAPSRRRRRWCGHPGCQSSPTGRSRARSPDPTRFTIATREWPLVYPALKAGDFRRALAEARDGASSQCGYISGKKHSRTLS